LFLEGAEPRPSPPLHSLLTQFAPDSSDATSVSVRLRPSSWRHRSESICLVHRQTVDPEGQWSATGLSQLGARQAQQSIWGGSNHKEHRFNA
jgi:hypothetical protein